MIKGDKHIRATPLHPKIGGKLDGIDLRENISDEVREEIHEHWMRFMVLVFPNQAISDEQHIAFGRKFGELEVHPSVAHRSSRNKEIYRVSNVDEADDDVELTEFSDEIEGWVIDALKAIGCDTARDVLNVEAADLVKRTDLEEETVNDVLAVLQAEFE